MIVISDRINFYGVILLASDILEFDFCFAGLKRNQFLLVRIYHMQRIADFLTIKFKRV